MKNGTGGSEAGEMFEGFVENVTGVEVGGDEDVGATGDTRLGELFLADVGVDGGVELHFSVDYDVGAEKRVRAVCKRSMVSSWPPLPKLEKESRAIWGGVRRSFWAER